MKPARTQPIKVKRGAETSGPLQGLFVTANKRPFPANNRPFPTEVELSEELKAKFEELSELFDVFAGGD
jgi:hypothetical protein